MTGDNDTSDSSDGATSRARFAGIRDTFEQAWHRGPNWESRYVFAGERIRLRIAGAALARYIDAPFAHLRVPATPEAPGLTIDLWDAAETGVAAPAPAHAHAAGQQWRLDDGRLAAAPHGRIVSHASRTSVVWLDRRARRLAGWVVDARELSLYERGRPLQILLALCAHDASVHAVHGAFVARGARGVLLVGDGGAGKSTAALCCLDAGFTYLGDDWIGVGRSAAGAIVGHSLYSSVSLEPAQVARFPLLRGHAIPPRNGTDLKSLILLADLFPARIGRTAAICALALPRVIDAADTRVRPASKKDALLTMARSAICILRPRAGRATMEALTRLAQEVPACRLEVGHDLEQIPRRVDEILAAAS